MPLTSPRCVGSQTNEKREGLPTCMPAELKSSMPVIECWEISSPAQLDFGKTVTLAKDVFEVRHRKWLLQAGAQAVLAIVSHDQVR